MIVVLLWIGSILLSFLPVLAKDAVVYGLSYYTFQYIPVIMPVAVRKCEIVCKKETCFIALFPLTLKSNILVANTKQLLNHSV